MNIKRINHFIQVCAIVAILSAPIALFAAPGLDLGLGKVKETGLTDFGVQGGGKPAIQALIVEIIKILLGITAAIAVLFIIIGGYQFITSAANPSGAKAGKETLKNAIIGLVIIMLSYAIVVAVTSFLSDPLAGGGGTTPSTGGTGGPPRPTR